MFTKKNKIVFKAQDKHVMEVRTKPVPATQLVPQWWKDLPPYFGNNGKFQLTDQGPNTTVKKCAPSLDAITSGYIVTLWADIQVETNSFEIPTAKWNTQKPVFSIWTQEQSSSFEIDENYNPLVFKYLHGWTIKTPPGYSCLITHPIGYQNLPFKAISGVVDTDKLNTDINTPIVFKKGFNGVIEKGTPMFQVIPIKRENWESEFELQEEQELFFNQEKLASTYISSYARNLREKKNYK